MKQEKTLEGLLNLINKIEREFEAIDGKNKHCDNRFINLMILKGFVLEQVAVSYIELGIEEVRNYPLNKQLKEIGKLTNYWAKFAKKYNTPELMEYYIGRLKLL